MMNVDELYGAAKKLIRRSVEDLCDVVALLPEMVEALPEEYQRKRVREIIKFTFRQNGI